MIYNTRCLRIGRLVARRFHNCVLFSDKNTDYTHTWKTACCKHPNV